MTTVQIPTPAQLHGFLTQRAAEPGNTGLESLLKRCVTALYASGVNDKQVVVPLLDEPERDVADAISTLRRYNWVAVEEDNGKGEGFTQLKIVSAPLTRPA